MTQQVAVACWACGATATESSEFAPDTVYACSACGLAFQAGTSSEEIRRRHDPEYFATYGDAPYADTASRSYEADVRVRLVRRYRPTGRLLELGPAAGYFLLAARRAGFDVVGIEPSSEMARAAAGLVGDEAVVCSSVEDAPLAPQSFDVVCAWHVLEHLVDPLATLERLRESLREGGYFFAEVPNYASVRSRHEGAGWALLDLAHHAAQYTPEALAELLRRAGFDRPELVTVPWAAYRPWPRSLLSHARQAALLRSWPAGSHPRKHELLRAITRVPG